MSHRLRHDGEIPESSATWAMEESEVLETRITSSRDSLGNAFGMVHILPAPTRIDADQMSPISAVDPFDVERSMLELVAAALVEDHEPDGGWCL